ncbi:putative endonuclease [Pseudobutyrivibrio sp. 49]|uniref:YraN family protein n=1 Tax=unclassified Pseudobutyrivibrio TaxID=2638619 RepID=UPI00088BC9A7|nr:MULTISPECIES: YraN family protein [unclassified Pseudobutyrivibrio]SDH40685.1 putative endonuclease [Pseudobutyrivibrio sp. 49]SFN45773.1 putative endonuclease [Pseudobutyrivibrio sp. UC1225]
MNNRRQGNDFEGLAADYLKRNGMWLLEQNYYCKMGEIDIVAKDGEYLVFVEVKYRKNKRAGSAAEAVNFNKMRKISRCADVYMMQHRVSGNTSVRFDVVAIEEGHLTHYKNAFEYIPIC